MSATDSAARGVHTASAPARKTALEVPIRLPLRTLKRAKARAPLAMLLALCTSACVAQPAAKPAPGVKLSQLADRVRIEINGRLFTEYLTHTTNPSCYPLIGPHGAPMTRNFPLKDVPGEEHDHLHHRSLWYAHGAVNGVDFWTEKPGAGRIVHRGFTALKSGTDFGLLQSTNDWVAADGKTICSDERTLRVFARPDSERLFDFEIKLHASHGELTFGDTKEAAMSLRVAETMRVVKETPKGQPPVPGDGHIVTSEGARDGDAWGKRAAWCDYSGPVNGQTVGIAIFDHPSNPRHPTWWFVREYGLHAANPFGQHAFEKTNDPHSGDLVVPAGKSVTFRYRFYLHEGDEKQSRVAERYADFATTKSR